MTMKRELWDFLGGSVVKILHFQCRDAEDTGSIPGLGAKIPHAARYSHKKKKKKKAFILYFFQSFKKFLLKEMKNN